MIDVELFAPKNIATIRLYFQKRLESLIAPYS